MFSASRNVGRLLTGHDSYTAIPRGCTSIGDVFPSIGEETRQIYHKNALRDGVVEGTDRHEYRQAISQGHGDEIGRSLMTLWLRHSKWLSSLPKSVPFLGHQHSREYGVIRQIEKRDDKLPEIGKPNAQIKSAHGRLRSTLANDIINTEKTHTLGAMKPTNDFG